MGKRERIIELEIELDAAKAIARNAAHECDYLKRANTEQAERIQRGTEANERLVEEAKVLRDELAATRQPNVAGAMLDFKLAKVKESARVRDLRESLDSCHEGQENASKNALTLLRKLSDARAMGYDENAGAPSALIQANKRASWGQATVAHLRREVKKHAASARRLDALLRRAMDAGSTYQQRAADQAYLMLHVASESKNQRALIERQQAIISNRAGIDAARRNAQTWQAKAVTVVAQPDMESVAEAIADWLRPARIVHGYPLLRCQCPDCLLFERAMLSDWSIPCSK